MRSSFPVALEHVRTHEGGYVNHPRDPGGETNHGITIATARRHGYDGDMRDLPWSVAAEIYRAEYWRAVRGDDLPAGVDLHVFDMGVNAGTATAARLLQRALGVTADGRIGPVTLAAARAKNERALIPEYTASRLRYYQSLRTFSSFGKGWTRRTRAAERVALGLLTGENV